jgi:hypothetical protein
MYSTLPSQLIYVGVSLGGSVLPLQIALALGLGLVFASVLVACMVTRLIG